MSEQQKIFASLSGAFVAHVLLLSLVFLLLSTRSASSSLRGDRRPERDAPKEVTILMSDLMEQITTEVPEPEARPFISTDLNRPESEAPQNARYESDRNTTAASELQPDESLPGERVPTLNGDNPLPHLTLQNREFIEGQLDEAPSTVAAMPGAPAGGQPVRPAGSSPKPLLPADSMPAADVNEGEEQDDREGEKELPKEMLDGQRSRQEGLNEASVLPDKQTEVAATDPGKTVQRSFVAPSDDPEVPVLGPMSAERDRASASKGEERANTDKTTDPEQMKEASASPPIPEEASGASSANASETLKPADEGLFSSGFSPEERKNVINGSLARVGQNAVDAEETAMGRYKKAVRDVISSTWHRYRQKNGDFVTWGILKLEFTVDREGQVKNLQITKNEANAILAEFTLKAIRDSKLPPMPEDVARAVGSEGLVIQYDIIIY